MRMSCNGCRVLRKGCSENCSIRPCLQWIKSPDSQAHATVFLAKFYGRAGLINLINSGPTHLRPAIFRSLLYEACGRVVNPIYGSVGLLWSGQWQLCQSAVENVLQGAPITPIAIESATKTPQAVKGTYDIRHVTKEDDDHHHRDENNSNSDRVRVKVKTTRTRFKRTGKNSKAAAAAAAAAASSSRVSAVHELTMTRADVAGSSTSHDDSTVSHPADEDASVASTEVNGCEGELQLDLTLGFGFDSVHKRVGAPTRRWE